ncbi:unnamed protein product, partial [Amoebophrya sp. A120]|eukprot:GSA120T00025622001.1
MKMAPSLRRSERWNCVLSFLFHLLSRWNRNSSFFLTFAGVLVNAQEQHQDDQQLPPQHHHGLLDPTPNKLYRGCQLCQDIPEVLADSFFFDSKDCMWPKKRVVEKTDTVVSCTLLSCVAVYLLCGTEKLTNENPLDRLALELPRFFIDYYHKLLVSGKRMALAKMAASDDDEEMKMTDPENKLKLKPIDDSIPVIIANRMKDLLVSKLPELHLYKQTYSSFSDSTKFHAGGFLAPEMLTLVENLVNFRRLFQWRFNFLNVACLRWSFMEGCSPDRIVFENKIPRFYRVKVVTDLLKSMWLRKVEEKEQNQGENRILEAGAAAGSRSTSRSHHDDYSHNSRAVPWYFDNSKYDYHDERVFPSEPSAEVMQDSIAHGLESQYVKQTVLKFVEVGVFQGRLAYSVLKTCPFVEYFGVDPYKFEAEDYEFQGLFTDQIEEKKEKEQGSVDNGGTTPGEALPESATASSSSSTTPGEQDLSEVDENAAAKTSTESEEEKKQSFAQALLEARNGARSKIGFFQKRARLLEKTSEEGARQMKRILFESGDTDTTRAPATDGADENGFNTARINAPSASIDFVFIDGDHRYEATFNDITYWYPLVKEKTGIIGGHDFGSNIEVTKAVMDFMRLYLPEDWKLYVDADWTWFFIKPDLGR